MPKRLPDTPRGMLCRKCGRDLPPYHFFKPRGRYIREFFANGIPDGHTCWDCGGNYKCLGCGQVKPASEYRVQGRYCADCRIEGIPGNGAVGSETPHSSHERATELDIGHNGALTALMET